MALADDIRRYLADRPITARSASATYQLESSRGGTKLSSASPVFVNARRRIVASTWRAVREQGEEKRRCGPASGRKRARRGDEAAQSRLEAQQAQQERNRALEAQGQAQEERNQALAAKQRADTEAAISQAVSAFLRNDVLAQATASEQSGPDTKPDPDLKVRTALDRASSRIGGKFRDQPQVEASIRETIGSAYQELGLYSEARPHLERALELRKKALGENAVATTEIIGSLAALSMQEGQYKPAEALYLKTLEGLRRAHGEEHPDVLKTMSHLAELYQSQGRYGEAETLILKTLKTQRRVLGAEHPDTLASNANLALTYYLDGKYADAQPVFEQILASQRRVLGTDHPDTLTTMANLALTVERQGKVGDAELLFVEALKAHRRVLGNEHLHATIIFNLALLYESAQIWRGRPLYLESSRCGGAPSVKNTRTRSP